MATSLAKLGFKVDTKGIDKATKKLKGLEKQGGKNVKNADKLGKGFKAAGAGLAVFAVAVAAVVVKTVSMVKEQAKAIDNIQKLSLRLGISTEALSEYAFVARLAGVSVEGFNTSLQRQVRRINEAASGAGEAKAALKALGLDAGKLATMAPEDQFEEIAEAMNKIQDSGKKVALAFKLWDTEGVRNLQIVNQGTKAIKAQREEAERFGLTLTKAEADGVAKMNDSITRLDASSEGFWRRLTLQLTPAIIAFNEALTTDSSKTWGDAIGETLREATEGALALLGIVLAIPAAMELGIHTLLGKEGEVIGFYTAIIKKIKTFLDTSNEVTEEMKQTGEETKELQKEIQKVYDIEAVNKVKDVSSAYADLILKLREGNVETQKLIDAANISEQSYEKQNNTLKIHNAVQAELNSLKAAGIVITTEHEKHLTTAITKEVELSIALERSKAGWKATTSALQDYSDSLGLTKDNQDDLIIGGMSSIEDNLVDMATGAKSAGEAFKDMADSIIKDIIRIIIQQIILKTIMSSMGFAGGGTTGANGVSPSDAQGTPFAGGGITSGPELFRMPGGRGVGIRGEAGPEAVVPLPDGRTIPVKLQGGGGGAGGAIINNITTNVNVEGNANADDSERIAQQASKAVEARVIEIMHEQRRPGNLSKQFSIG